MGEEITGQLYKLVRHRSSSKPASSIAAHQTPILTMAPNPQCAALAAAKERKGLSYSQIAQQLGSSEQHVIDVCTGKSTPTQAEFDALARVLDIKSAPPHDSAHSTK
ncbi:hypothetical protein OBBRIDRAFT_793519 [Obba rivulosa]|uniref:HTH cro/C1-type domain-containing protein n=1 Tax=Obba rivulosa TaxID=1052685 RepID=A0A8E2ATQ8_9APHY|nr:hypothetical protein OBBRIDRAFT_793519 [Obba rivulosa]